MSIIEKDKGKMIEKDAENKGGNVIRTYRVFPEIFRRLNNEDNTIEVEISLPGVKKQDIILKTLPHWFHLDAKRDEFEYSANQDWGTEIVPEKTEAVYENGLLRITAHIKDPFADAVQVKI